MKGTSKSIQRFEVRARLAALSPEKREAASIQIAKRLNMLERWSAAQSVALFAPLPTEPNIGWPEGKKIVAFPRLIETEPPIELRQVTDPATLVTIRTPQGWDLREPTAQALPIRPDQIEAILVPGLAFDRRGVRLGRGGGWYDRLLSQLPQSTLKIGLFFAAQELAEIEREPHDVPLDLVLTETETIEF